MRPLSLSLALAGLAGASGAALAQPAPAPDTAQLIADLRAAAAAAEETARIARERADAAERALRAAAPATAETVVVEENLSVPDARQRILQRNMQASQHLLQTGIARGVANGPNDRLLRSGLSPELQLTATSTDKIATLSWTIDVSGAPRAGRLEASQLTLTATTELDSQKEAQIGGIRGFAGGTEIKLTAIQFLTGFRPATTERPQVTLAQENCRRRKAAEGVVAAQVATQCDAYNYEGGVGRFVADFNPGQYRQMLDEALPGPVWFFGGNLGANQTDFNYLDQSAFTMRKVSHFGYTGTAFGGVILSSGLTSISGSFTFGRRYRARDPITLCQAVNAIPQTRCITAPGGAPTRRDQAILALEFRHSFGAAVGEFADAAIAPEFSIDLNNNSYSLDLPIYLIGDGQGQLRGGIRFGYVNSGRTGGGRDEDVNLGLFVGVPFSLFH